ncbi:DUF819 domain-containing protein [Methylophaga sp. OBS4]|uniref:DUF819 family protein n=1 Tax=Methylophaga sp. OBS4 TaxID=2991935 RepID=UPI0022561338|nr:DUF819 family protein [Methylophaga sp. OBS4]MCX4186608.1 DUF819 family protein [Methylophaga sp. OBS4]
MASIIPADQTFAVLAALFAIALFGFWAEKKPWGKMLTGAVWAILIGILLSNLRIIPQQAPAYNVVFSYFVPMLLPLFLMHADVKRILAESGRVGIAFILSCIGTVSGAIIAASVVDLGENENILAGMFTATYTGGSANFAALIQSTGFDDASAIAAATAVDNLLGVVFLIILVAMPASSFLMKRYVERYYAMDDKTALQQGEKQVSGLSLAAAITFAMAVVALSDIVVALLNSLAATYDFSILRYLFITLFAVLPATFAPGHMQKMHGGQSIGLVLALVFFATIAAGADVATLLAHAPILLLFVLILLSTHWIVTFGGGALLTKLFKRMGKDKELGLSLPELIIASNAAILGATTAPALAMARGWGTLVTPGILVGVAGYIIGTPLGLLIASWW